MAARRVIISGGTSGIGAATARHLLGSRSAVWILGRRAEAVQTPASSYPAWPAPRSAM